VLTPTKKGALGTRELNKALQSVLNPHIDGLPEKTSGGVVYRVGDRIMQIKNNYDMTWEKEKNVDTKFPKPGNKNEIGTGVFNGEMGTIIQIDEKQKVVKIKFDDEKLAWYEYSDLEQIEHSYAITIHKAQRK
jgi:exodeoxyribonuclease V alpha subunit